MATMQGASAVTPTKELQINGIVKMRLSQRKKGIGDYISEVAVYDVFCGDGSNMVEGQTVDGSPLEILDAILKSGVDARLYASDISETACNNLSRLLMHYQNRVQVDVCDAKDSLRDIGQWLHDDKKRHAIIVVDPNGPGVMPWSEMLTIAKHFHRRADLVINISETAMKRILNCRVTKDKNWWAGYESFTEVLYAIKRHYRSAWIRDALKSDPQKWRLFCCWSFAPPSEWIKQSLYQVNTQQDIFRFVEGVML